MNSQQLISFPDLPRRVPSHLLGNSLAWVGFALLRQRFSLLLHISNRIAQSGAWSVAAEPRFHAAQYLAHDPIRHGAELKGFAP